MAESSESPISSPDIKGITAPLLFGPLFNWALYGVLCVQIYVYSYNFPKDSPSLKFLAYFIFLLETAQTALTGADVYYWFVAGFGDVKNLENSHLSPIDNPIMTSVISLIVQGYFCCRIWKLNRRSSWVCWIIAVASLTQSGAAMEAGIKSLVFGNKYVTGSTKLALYLWSISTALADILIAGAMTLLLRRATGKFASFVLIRVVRITIETNTLTASLAVTIIVLYAAFPNKLYYVVVTEIIGKVYSNTLLLNLNNRIYFREHSPPQHSDRTYSTFFDRVRDTTTQTSISFAVPEPHPRTPIVESFQLSAISQTLELSNGQCDDTSINSCPSCPRKCHPIPNDPE
ncbi:hypothetical protein V8E53_014184 [Lactarius tabidus]